ncbi:MAG TPA: tetratricopeptide repeat protein [Patescibacteria group bacterium]|nr:tetratricopeptide repeat protein [Patescibacteria group bacterium]
MRDRKNNNTFFILFVVLLGVGGAGFFRASANPMALKFFAALGDADAQRHLGEINLYGNPKDYAEALRLFQLAAKKGDLWAESRLGTMYAEGWGVQQDFEQAKKLWTDGASKGFAGAEYNLGVLYQNGDGVEQDSKQAKFWYQKAAAQGHPLAQKELSQLAQVDSNPDPDIGKMSTAPRKNININIQIDPEVSRANHEYDRMVASLSPAEQQELKALDGELVKAIEPKIEIKSQEAEFSACAKSDPTFEARYKQMMQTFRLRKMDDLTSLHSSFMERISKIDYIDKEALGKHLSFQETLSTEMAGGLAMAAAQMDKDGKLCAKLKHDLETEYATPYVVADPRAMFDSQPMRDEISGRIKECSFGLREDTKDGHVISTTIHFEGPEVSFSAKVANPDMSFVPVSDLWINFGDFDTRREANFGQRNQAMLMGTMPPTTIIPILSAVRDGNVVYSVSTAAAGKPYLFAPAAAQPQLANTVASCVATLQPDYLEPLRKAGLSPMPDPRDVEAMSAPPKDFIYNVSALNQGENPVGCVWQTTAHTESDGAQAAAVVIVYGAAGPMTNMTEFWLMGADPATGGRLIFNDFQVTAKTSDGKVIEPAKIKRAKITMGQLAKIALTSADAGGIVNAIAENGMEVSGRTQENKTFNYTLPAPEPESLKAYNGCLDRLQKYISEHKNAPQAKSVAPAPDIAPNAGPDEKYLAYVDQAMADPSTANWIMIRELYPDTSFYKKIGGTYLSHASQEFMAKMGDNPTPEQIAAYKTFMRDHFASIGAHSRAIGLYDKTKAGYINVEQEKQIYHSLFTSILSSGDSLSPATAMKAISVEEVSYVLSHSPGGPPAQPTFKQDNGNYYAIAEIRNPKTGDMMKTYFLVDGRALKGP